MPRLIALLRAINVGGHIVKMDHLRGLFEKAGFASVETFIASGNVIFETKDTERAEHTEGSSHGGTERQRQKTAALETKIEARLRKALGYDVATFLRTDAEIADVAAYAPFAPAAIKAALAFNIGFLKEKLDAAATRTLTAFTSDFDAFHTHKREIYWLCKVRQSDSKFSNVKLEKAIGLPCTWRGANTVRKLAAKYPPGKKG